MLSNMLDLTLDVSQVGNTQNVTGMIGGNTKAFTTRLSSVACSYKMLTSTETDTYGKRSIFVRHRFYVKGTAANRAIIESDRITFDSGTFEILSINNVAGKNRTLQIDCLKVE